MDQLPIESRVKAALSRYSPDVRLLLLRILTNRDDAQRAAAIGELYADERSRLFAELLIDLEREPAARAVIVGFLRGLHPGPER